MNLGAAFSALFTKAEGSVKDAVAGADLKERNWSSLRWLGLLAFVGLIVYNTTSQLLTPASLELIFKAFALWMICNTATRIFTIAANAWTRTKLAALFDADGKITEEEAAALAQSVAPVSGKGI